MPSPDEILQRMDEILEESSADETTPLDGLNPVARNHLDAIRRQAEENDEDF
jgi:hypothetical protein